MYSIYLYVLSQQITLNTACFVYYVIWIFHILGEGVTKFDQTPEWSILKIKIKITHPIYSCAFYIYF